MKKFKNLFLTTIGVLSLMACEEEPEAIVNPTPVNQTKVTAQFVQSLVNVPEDSESREFQIRLDKPAIADGSLILNVASESMSEFVTSPALGDGKIILPVTAGQQEIKFSITPVNDAVLKQDRTISFALSSGAGGFLIGEKKLLTVTISEDESFVTASFLENISSLNETYSEGTTLNVTFSDASPAAGSVELSLTMDKAVYGVDFTTQPQAVNGKILMPVVTGAKELQVKILPVNNQIITGNSIVKFAISATSGVIAKGTTINHELTLQDDDAAGVSRGYTVTASGWWGSWNLKRYYTYREDGLLSKINWQQNTPGLTSGSYTYHYDANNQLTSMTGTDLTETIYSYESGKIVKADKFKDGILKQYNTYAYDDAGNVGESAIFYRQPDGSMKLTFIIVYLYYLDGNLYKQLTYVPIEGSEEYNLISTKTFEEYNNYSNPFPMAEILPNVNAQKNLPGIYRLEESGTDVTYAFRYEYDNAGRPISRRVISGQTNEVAYYEYF